MATRYDQGYQSCCFLPSPQLRDFVRQYDYIKVPNGSSLPQPVAPTVLPAIAFFLGDPFRAFEYDLKAWRSLPPIVVTGPLTQRVADIVATKGSATLSVTFHPTGLSRLFHVAAADVRDRAYDCADVLGKDLKELHTRLCEAASAEAMIAIVEETLPRKLRQGASPMHWVQQAANLIEHSHGQGRLAPHLVSLGLEERRVRRQFVSQIGMSPKRLAQVVRFNYTLGLKRRFPERLWTQICHEAGYFDQSHMHAEFMSLAKEAPSRFLSRLSSSPSLLPHDD